MHNHTVAEREPKPRGASSDFRLDTYRGVHLERFEQVLLLVDKWSRGELMSHVCIQPCRCGLASKHVEANLEKISWGKGGPEPSLASTRLRPCNHTHMCIYEVR